MNAQELRIGNWVRTGVGEEIIYELYTHKCAVGLETASTVRYSEIKPIHLTEKWLLKFGFKKIDKYTFVRSGWFVYKRKRGFVSGSKKREIHLDFVHVFQNWWFGNNKEDLK